MAHPLAAHEVSFGALRCRVRELCGGDLLAVHGDDTRAALDLLERLLVAADGQALRAEELTAAERDRVLAEVYLRTYGARIAASPRCVRCEQRFDTDFDLRDLMGALWPAPPPREVTLDVDRRFRVPSGADELAVAELSREQALRALAKRCAVDAGAREGDAAAFGAALETAAPVLDMELSAACPECGADNALGFRIQSYLLRSLAEEREALVAELDLLARAYGWSLSELLDLPRSMRVQLVRLVEGQRMRRAG